MVSALVALSLLSLACTANKKPSKVESTLANVSKDIVIPLEAEDLKNPLPATKHAVQQGRQIYVQSCALCHGEDGRGNTSLGRAMYPPAMDLTSPHVQHWSDAEIFWIIENGVRLTGMPSWKSSISELDTWRLANFIHALPELDSEHAAQAILEGTGQELIGYGRTLYRQEGCFTCHQLNGEGGKVGPDLTVEGTRGRSKDWLIGHFQNPPAYTPGSIMPAFKNLTAEQLKALAAFLEAQKGA
jgi:mono/diheme cytochrome c family protein